MARGRSITLSTKSFQKYGDALAFFKTMLGSYSLHDRVLDDDAEHLKALLKRHDEEDEKIGSGIDYFAVAPAPDYPSQRCFWIMRTDGSRIDFSYQHCLDKKPYD